MNTKFLAAIAAASVLGLSGCADMGGIDRQTAGTVGGAVLGGVVGNAVGGGTLGTLGGAAVGGVIGNQVTKPANRY